MLIKPNTIKISIVSVMVIASLLFSAYILIDSHIQSSISNEWADSTLTLDDTNMESANPYDKEGLEIQTDKVSTNHETKTPVAGVSGDSKLVFTHAQLSYDPSNIKTLVENKPSVFVGRLLKRVENKGVDENYTWPTFTVEVLSSIKGKVSNQIFLAQTDLRYSNDKIYVTNGDMSWPSDVKESDILFKTGHIYLFAASYSEGKDLYGVGMAPYDRVLLSADPSVSAETAIDLAKQNARVQELVKEINAQGSLSEEWR